jgi:hypothetical protein
MIRTPVLKFNNQAKKKKKIPVSKSKEISTQNPIMKKKKKKKKKINAKTMKILSRKTRIRLHPRLDQHKETEIN